MRDNLRHGTGAGVVNRKVKKATWLLYYTLWWWKILSAVLYPGKTERDEELKDCKVIPGSDIVSQHRIAVLDMDRCTEAWKLRMRKFKSMETKSEFRKDKSKKEKRR